MAPGELRTCRRDLGLTQAELATALGVATNTVARWERGELPIGHPELVRLGLERLGQAGAPRQRRPGPRTAKPAAGHNLPTELSSFIGREQQLAELASTLGTVRLLTLTGVGGVGKSRLALRVAGAVLDHQPDGVWLVELAALTDPALVPRAVGAVLGARQQLGRPLLATLTDALRPRRLLLVLDNCEHLVEACAGLADALYEDARTCGFWPPAVRS